MALTTKLTRRVSIPNEPGEWMDFNVLSWRQFKAAAEAKVAASMKQVSGLPADMLRSMQDIAASRNVTAPASAGEVPADPLDTYDQETLLIAGIANWSYVVPVSVEAIGSLDNQTAAWAARTIADLNNRSDDDRLNGLRPSIVS